MNLESERTFNLILLSAQVCRHCSKFKTDKCPSAPTVGTREHQQFIWSSLSTCREWTPDPIADEALQILTFRKLAGEDIDHPEKKNKYHDDEAKTS